jgi:iron complex transport system substrate-binding protein
VSNPRDPVAGRHRTAARARIAAAVAAVAMCVVVATACGSPDAADRSDAAGDGEAVTIEHRYGTTEIVGRPERIVSLDTQWTDVLAAMGAPPVAYALDPTVEGGSYPWRGDRLAQSEGIEIESMTIPFERVAELRPDLIVVTWAAQEESDYERLSEIAPTIPLLTGNEVDAWQDIARAAGEVLGEPARADDLVAEAEAAAEGVRAELPGLAGKTVAMANFVPGDGIHVVADPEDGSSVLFEQLGLGITPTILDQADDASGRVRLSMENTAALDADLLVLFTNGADPEDMPGYESLPAVRDGAVAVLDYAAVVGLNTPTPLSIPYSLEHIRPALEAAAA